MKGRDCLWPPRLWVWFLWSVLVGGSFRLFCAYWKRCQAGCLLHKPARDHRV